VSGVSNPPPKIVTKHDSFSVPKFSGNFLVHGSPSRMAALDANYLDPSSASKANRNEPAKISSAAINPVSGTSIEMV